MLVQCTIGKGGGQGCILFTMKYMCQNTCLFEKRLELVQETSGTMFFKARSQFFLGIFKNVLIRRKGNPQDDHSK